MASVTTPTINKIIRLNNYDLLGTKCKKYNMYMCLDTLQLWYDESDSKRTLYGYVGVDTVNDLQNNIIPELGVTYYCWESNSLWLWMNKWICIYTDGSYPSAYRTDNGTIDEIYLDDQQPTIVDNNGLLRDGSVVIRDANRIIKGRLYISDKHDNLVISSYLGGGVRILPNGAFSSDGELYIDDNAKAHIRGEWNVLNNEIYVDYTEKPTKDNNKYADDTHRYKVWHEGNLKLEDLQLTGLNIYNKIIEAQRDGSLPDPLVLNVDRLNGMKSTDFALKSHVHKSTDIPDFKTASQANALQIMIDKLTNMVYKGAKITWSDSTQKFTLSTDNFILSFTGGATGKGTVTNNTNTTIALTVDPTKHVHQDLVNRIVNLEKGGGIDLSNYYTKPETEALVDDYFTTTPTPGKALLIDSNKTLPANAKSASDLDHDTKLILQGDIEGNVTFGYENSQLVMSTSADNIISDTPTDGKALKLDSDGNLPTTAYKAKELNHTINVELSGVVKGKAELDTSATNFKIITSLDTSGNVLTSADIGVRVPSLVGGIVPESQLPEGIMNALKIVGNWDGGSAPISNPKEGQAWVVTTKTTFGGKNYNIGDWIYYHDSSWNRADIGVSVKSVNGKSGENITLVPSDIGAISDTYINYTVGADIPANKIVITDSTGHIAGAKVDSLTNPFSLLTTNGDVAINTTKSTNTKTDGTSNLNVTLELTNAGYENIKTKVVPSVMANMSLQPWRKYINFVNFKADVSTNQVDLTPDLDAINNIMYFNGTASSDFLNLLNTKLSNKDITPFYIAFKSNNALHLIGINSGTTLSNGNNDIKSDECTVTHSGSTTTIKTSVGRLVMSSGSATGFSIVGSTATFNSLQLSGGTMTGDITFADVTSTTYPADSKKIKFSGSTDAAEIYYRVTASDAGELVLNLRDDANARLVFAYNGTTKSYIDTNGNFSGNAASSTKLATARTINGTSFNGSANITTANWGTARTLTIGSTGKSVNGSANVSWTLAEIGAAASSHTHSYLPLSGGTMTGAITNNSVTKDKPVIASNLSSSWIDGMRGASAIKFTSGATGMRNIAVGNSTNGHLNLFMYNGALGAGYMNNTTYNAGTNSLTKTNTLCDEGGNMVASGRMTCAALTVNGKKVFIQSGTPSGAASGDIWIVTK